MSNFTRLLWTNLRLLLWVTLFSTSTTTFAQDLPSVPQPPGASLNAQQNHLRVAILPFATARYRTWTTAEWDLERFSVEFVNRKSSLKLINACDCSGIDGGLGIDPNLIWQEGHVRKAPKESPVYALVDRLNADVALTYFYAPRTSGWYGSQEYMVEVYVFDLEYKRLYHDGGDERSYSVVTEQLFDQLVRDRFGSTKVSSSSQTGTTMAATLAALKVLHEKGVITDEEYVQKQRVIIEMQLD